MTSWVLLTYKVAREPSARRVHVWRRLKRLGAILIDEAVWVLPNQPYTREQFQWLAAEIHEMEGSAMVWEAQLLLGVQDADLTRQFQAQVEVLYRAILADLDQADAEEPDLVTLTKRYQQVSRQDYLHSSLGPLVRDRLAAARDDQKQEQQALEPREERWRGQPEGRLEQQPEPIRQELRKKQKGGNT